MAHPDLDALLNTVLPFAEEMLGRFGEFLPFGAAMRTDGSIVSIGAQTDEAHSKSQDLIDILEEAFLSQAQAGDLLAAAICYDSLTVPPGRSEKTDAVAVRLQHLVGGTVDVYVSYARTGYGGIRFGEVFACPGSLHIFPHEPGAA